MFISLALDRAFERLFHDYKKNKKQVTLLFSTIYWFILGYGLFVVLLCISTSSLWFENLLEIPVYPYIYLSFIPVLLNQLSILGRSVFSVTLETKKLALIDASSVIINGGFSVLLMVVWNLGIIGRLSGIAIASLYLAIYYAFYLVKNKYIILSFSKKMFLESIKYSAPLIPFVASVWIGSLSDRLILSLYGGFDKVGIYSLAFQLATIVYVIGDGLTRVSNVLITSGLIVDQEETKNKISNYSFIAWITMLSGVFGIFYLLVACWTCSAQKL